MKCIAFSKGRQCKNNTKGGLGAYCYQHRKTSSKKLTEYQSALNHNIRLNCGSSSFVSAQMGMEIDHMVNEHSYMLDAFLARMLD